MLASLTLNDATGAAVTLHETAKRYITTVSGLVGVSPTRDLVRPRPQAHGGIDDTRYTDLSTIVVEGECFSTAGGSLDAQIQDALAEFRLIVKPMLETLDQGAALLKWQEAATGLPLQKLVKLASDVDPILSESAPVVRWQAQFRAEDPRAYSQTLTTQTGVGLSVAGGGLIFNAVFNWIFSSSGGGTVSFTNAGNRPTPPVFRIYGFAVNPTIVLLTTPQKRIVLNGTVNAGDYLELDVGKRTIKLNGTTSRLNFLDAANTQWFELPAGTSNLQLIAGSFDGSARLDILARSAYA
jgi:hypothetical protein